MGWTIVTPPAAEPITRDEARLHLKMDASNTLEDALIDGLIAAAREVCEVTRGEQLMPATYDLTLDRFPCLHDRRCCDFSFPFFDRDAIEIWRGPLQSVASIAYTDENGEPQTLSSALYQVDTASRVGRIAPAFGQVWPYTRRQLNAVTVRLEVGYAASDATESEQQAAVPAKIKAAMKLLVGHLYRNREAVNVGNIVTEMPFAVKHLLDSDRLTMVG